MDKLPETKSELLRLAVADMRLCAADPQYTLDMSDWVVPGSVRCSVCLAGAVMVQTLRCLEDPTLVGEPTITPSMLELPDESWAKLIWLNDAAFGIDAIGRTLTDREAYPSNDGRCAYLLRLADKYEAAGD